MLKCNFHLQYFQSAIEFEILEISAFFELKLLPSSEHLLKLKLSSDSLGPFLLLTFLPKLLFGHPVPYRVVSCTVLFPNQVKIAPKLMFVRVVCQL